MISSVHIPIYLENEAAKFGVFLTLKTIRVGFPTLPIFVHWMISREGNFAEVQKMTQDIIGTVICHDRMRNDQLIKMLVEREQKGFAVVDSDMVFFGNCEGLETDALIAGEFIPSFNCPIARARTASRLHSAFFVVPDPPRLRSAIAKAYEPVLPQFCPFDPFAPVAIFDGPNDPFFYDSCSILYHAVGGEKFDDAMLDKFEHCWAGSYAWKLPGPHWQFLHDVFANPKKARGFRSVVRQQLQNAKVAA